VPANPIHALFAIAIAANAAPEIRVAGRNRRMVDIQTINLCREPAYNRWPERGV
jgi:hypothetical protein